MTNVKFKMQNVKLLLLFGAFLISASSAQAQVSYCAPGTTACSQGCTLGVNCTSCWSAPTCTITGQTAPTCGSCQCPSGQIVCGSACQLPAATSGQPCDAGQGAGSGTFDSCGVCQANAPRYATRQYSFPGTAEDGYINIKGNLRTSSDMYLTSGKAIRVDGSGATPTILNIGNFTGTGGVNVTILGTLALDALTADRVTGDELCIGVDCRTSWPVAEGGGLTGSGTANQVAFFTSASNLDSDANLFWDNINKRLGIGTATTPGSTLTVRRSAAGVAFAVRNTGDNANTFAITDTGLLTVGVVPWAQLRDIPSACASGKFVIDIESGTCALPSSAAESDPVYLAWYNSANPGISNLKVVGGGAFGGYTPDATWKITTPNIYIGDPAVGGTIIGAGSGQSAGDITTDGNLVVKGCFGAIYRGGTLSTYQGNVSYTDPVLGTLNGYKAVNEICKDSAGILSGSHVCSVQEILESIKCGAALPGTGIVWVQDGPPGFTANVNDCIGWTSPARPSFLPHLALFPKFKTLAPVASIRMAFVFAKYKSPLVLSKLPVILR